MAAPHIAGIAAQLFQDNPSATPAQVEDALKSTAYQYVDGAAYQTVGAYSTSFDKGTGLVDVVAASAAVGGSGDETDEGPGKGAGKGKGPKPRG